MNAISYIALGGVLMMLTVSATGCGSAGPRGQSDTASGHHAVESNEGERQANMAKLNEEDRLLAEAQGYCAVSTEPLGSMGTPLKLVLNDQLVFVCCKGCEKKAKATPDQTLAKADELKARVKAEQQR